MRLRDRTLSFDRITHHANTTQCLGSVNGKTWYLGVIPSTIVDEDNYLPPAVEDARVFKVEGPRFLKLHRGTWHAGPLFTEPYMDFYNLELSNTNVSFHPPLLHLRILKCEETPGDYCKNGDVNDCCTLKPSLLRGSVLMIMIRTLALFL